VLRGTRFGVLSDTTSIALQLLGETLARRARTGSLFGGIAQLAESAVAPMFVLELVRNEFDHDGVIEKAQTGHVVGNQIVGVGEMGNRRQHRIAHLLGCRVILVQCERDLELCRDVSSMTLSSMTNRELGNRRDSIDPSGVRSSQESSVFFHHGHFDRLTAQLARLQLH